MFEDDPRFFPGGGEELAVVLPFTFSRGVSSGGAMFLRVDSVQGALVPDASALAVIVSACFSLLTGEAGDVPVSFCCAKLDPTCLYSLLTGTAREDSGFVCWSVVGLIFAPFPK